MMAQKRFHRHFETPGLPLYWIIIAYIILGWFFPVIGLLAIICMIGPVVSKDCAHIRFPTVHGVLHLRHVRHPTKFCALERGWTSHVGWYR